MNTQQAINLRRPAELTLRGTIAVRTAGYLVGDRVLVRINGQNVGATVVRVSAFSVEVSPGPDIINTWIDP